MYQLLKPEPVRVRTRVGLLAGGVLSEERIGVKMNNERLKCQRKRVKGEKGDGIDEYTGGVCEGKWWWCRGGGWYCLFLYLG